MSPAELKELERLEASLRERTFHRIETSTIQVSYVNGLLGGLRQAADELAAFIRAQKENQREIRKAR